jgi:DUF4097 and DUF4098 domain-containing protein YvlB
MITNRFARRRLPAAIGALVTLALLAAAGLALADRREGEPFHWNGRMPAGSTLEIHGVNGLIEAAPSSGPDITVDAEKWARRGDPDRVRIAIERSHDITIIRAVYPHEWFNFGNSDVNVHFTVHVPPKIELKLFSVNGPVDAVGLENRVAARTVNGRVHIETEREAEARTVNGSIQVRAVPRAGELHFRSVNGSVRLEIPSEASARLYARTVNGVIQSDFPATRIQHGWIGRRYEGLVGRGDADLEVTTVNGSILVRRI